MEERKEEGAHGVLRASEAGVFARALDEVPASPRAATPSPRLPPSLPSVLLSSEEGKWQWPVKYVNFSSFPPPVALNQDVAATAAHEFARMSPTVWVGLHPPNLVQPSFAHLSTLRSTGAHRLHAFTLSGTGTG